MRVPKKSKSITPVLQEQKQVENVSSPIQDNRPEAVAQQKIQDLANASAEGTPVQKKKNETGMPDQLKAGVETLSGHSMDDVKVHYNSNKPAQLNAHAYAQGNQIHLGAGQEKHLPHEAWHVAQQKQGRVQPTVQKNGVSINDNKGLEKEADVMGNKALSTKPAQLMEQAKAKTSGSPVAQRVVAQLFPKLFSKGRARMLMVEGGLHIAAAIATALVSAAGIGLTAGAATLPLFAPIMASVAQAFIGVLKFIRARLMLKNMNEDDKSVKSEIKKALGIIIGIESVLWALSLPAVFLVGGTWAVAMGVVSTIGASVKLVRGILTATKTAGRFLGFLVILETILGGFGNIAGAALSGGAKLIAPIVSAVLNGFKSLRGIFSTSADLSTAPAGGAAGGDIEDPKPTEKTSLLKGAK